jgi:hypothetical protein
MWLFDCEGAVDRDLLRNAFLILIRGKDYKTGKNFIVSPVKKEIEAGCSYDYESLIEVDKNVCQDLVNDLWRLGFRPHEDIGSYGQLEAMKEHIKDLRDVIYKVLK